MALIELLLIYMAKKSLSNKKRTQTKRNNRLCKKKSHPPRHRLLSNMPKRVPRQNSLLSHNRRTRQGCPTMSQAPDGYIEGLARNQTFLMPKSIEEYVAPRQISQIKFYILLRKTLDMNKLVFFTFNTTVACKTDLSQKHLQTLPAEFLLTNSSMKKILCVCCFAGQHMHSKAERNHDWKNKRVSKCFKNLCRACKSFMH
jgi:hypothetical protein